MNASLVTPSLSYRLLPQSCYSCPDHASYCHNHVVPISHHAGYYHNHIVPSHDHAGYCHNHVVPSMSMLAKLLPQSCCPWPGHDRNLSWQSLQIIFQETVEGGRRRGQKILELYHWKDIALSHWCMFLKTDSGGVLILFNASFMTSIWPMTKVMGLWWDEMRWNEMGWDEMKWDEMRWGILWVTI